MCRENVYSLKEKTQNADDNKGYSFILSVNDSTEWTWPCLKIMNDNVKKMSISALHIRTVIFWGWDHSCFLIGYFLSHYKTLNCIK